MRQVTLQFPSILELIDFTLEVAEKACEVKRLHLILICNLAEAEVELARSRYKAIVLG